MTIPEYEAEVLPLVNKLTGQPVPLTPAVRSIIDGFHADQRPAKDAAREIAAHLRDSSRGGASADPTQTLREPD